MMDGCPHSPKPKPRRAPPSSTVASYDVFADLTAEPVRSRTEIRFTCTQPGAPRSPT
jgi:hypothetical protein